MNIAQAPVRGCIDSCRRALFLIEDLVAKNYFSEGSKTSLGEHLRHCLDHFNCFLNGIPEGPVDYDARQRQPELAASPNRLRLKFLEVIESLQRLDPNCFLKPIEVRSSACKGSGPVKLQSTVSRELVFLSSHTLHHLEIARLIAEIDGFKTKPDLALAFSTAARLEGTHSAYTGSRCAQ